MPGCQHAVGCRAAGVLVSVDAARVGGMREPPAWQHQHQHMELHIVLGPLPWLLGAWPKAGHGRQDSDVLVSSLWLLYMLSQSTREPTAQNAEQPALRSGGCLLGHLWALPQGAMTSWPGAKQAQQDHRNAKGSWRPYPDSLRASSPKASGWKSEVLESSLWLFDIGCRRLPLG